MAVKLQKVVESITQTASVCTSSSLKTGKVCDLRNECNLKSKSHGKDDELEMSALSSALVLVLAYDEVFQLEIITSKLDSILLSCLGKEKI